MTVCVQCGEDKSWFKMGSENTCLQCHTDIAYMGRKASDDARAAPIRAAEEMLEREIARIILTTEAAHNLPVGQRIDILTTEVVIGMHLFKDIASAFRDTFGGRSKVMQDGLRDARKTALSELRREAHAIGADAVVGIALNYSEISGGGKSMLFLVASGTAVTLEQPTHAPA